MSRKKERKRAGERDGEQARKPRQIGKKEERRKRTRGEERRAWNERKNGGR